MDPMIVDRDTGRELWTSAQCADHAGISRATWSAYVSRDFAPASVGTLDRLTVWDATEVQEWQAKRGG